MDSAARGGTLEGLGGPVRMDEVEYGGIDPTLDACCQREVQSNRYANALTRTLARHDVTALAERRRKHLVTTLDDNFTGCRCCFDPNSDGGEYRALMELREKRQNDKNEEQNDQNEDQIDQNTNNTNNNTDSDTSDDEFDYLLDDEDIGEPDSLLKQAEERRKAELEYAALTQQITTQHGYGVHRQMHPTRILRAAGLGETKKHNSEIIAPAVVIHLVDPDSIASASLDLFLEELAGHRTSTTSTNPNSHYFGLAKGTKFMRSGGRSVLLMDAGLSARVLPRLQPDRDLPALIAVREGSIVSACPRLAGLTADPMEDEVDVDAVYQWLDRCGVLLLDPPRFDQVCRIRPEEEALMDYLETSAAAATSNEEERYDCGNPDCNKSFPHEHVGFQNEQQSGLVVSEQEVLGETD